MEYFSLPPFISDGVAVKIPIYRARNITSRLLFKSHMLVQVTLQGYRIIRTKERIASGTVLPALEFAHLIIQSDVIGNPVEGILIYIQ